MRTIDKPNCSVQQLGSLAISIANRFQELTTHIFMLNESAIKNSTGSFKFTGSAFAMTTVIGRGGV